MKRRPTGLADTPNKQPVFHQYMCTSSRGFEAEKAPHSQHGAPNGGDVLTSFLTRSAGLALGRGARPAKRVAGMRCRPHSAK